MAYATARHTDTDMLIVCVPNKKYAQSSGWVKNKRLDVGILFINKKVRVRNMSANAGFVTLDLENCRVICCYISPNVPMDKNKDQVNRIMGKLRGGKEEYLILGDINTKSARWGSQ